jgi:hypothetical protein
MSPRSTIHEPSGRNGLFGSASGLEPVTADPWRWRVATRSKANPGLRTSFGMTTLRPPWQGREHERAAVTFRTI